MPVIDRIVSSSLVTGIVRPMVGAEGAVLARIIQGWTGLENCFEPVQAALGGASHLRRDITVASEANALVIVQWFWLDSGSNKTFLFDVGDPITPDVETTRLEIDAAGRLDVFLSMFTVGPGWAKFAEVLNISAIGVNQWHQHITLFNNDVAGGPGTQLLEVIVDGVSVGTDTSFTNETVSSLAGDQVHIGADHTGSNVITGRFMEFRSYSGKMTAADAIATFWSPRTTTDFVNGSPPFVPDNMLMPLVNTNG